MGERQGPIQPQHPEAPLKPTSEAYVRGAMTTLFCLAISESLGDISMDQPTRTKLAEITAQAPVRPQPADTNFAESVKTGALWYEAAIRAASMFESQLTQGKDESQTLELWTNALLLAAGISEDESDKDVLDKKAAIQQSAEPLWKFRHNPTLSEEGRLQGLARVSLPIWCTETNGFSTDARTDMTKARKLYSDLWDFSWDVDPNFMQKIYPPRR